MLQEGETLARIAAAALSVAVTEAILVLVRRPHTPAGTTTLLVSLGLFTTPPQVIYLLVGVVLVTATAPSLTAPSSPRSPLGTKSKQDYAWTVSKFTP